MTPRGGDTWDLVPGLSWVLPYRYLDPLLILTVSFPYSNL